MLYLSPGLRSILLVSPAEQDRTALESILASSGVTVRRVSGLREALDRLSGQDTPVVLCESNLPDGGWKDLFESFEALICPPRLIVFSRLADDRLWSEVLNLGGYDVLATPFLAEEARRVVLSARDSWLRELATSAAPALRSFRAAQ